MISVGKFPRPRPAFVWLVALTLLMALVLWAVTRLGYWLVVEDRLEPSRAIVVLTGGFPFRAMEAARLYHLGFAPEVWLIRGSRPAAEATLSRLGVQVIREETYNREVLVRLRVPAGAIRLLDDPILNTADEVLLVSNELRNAEGNRVILVTSKPHTRRVKAIWHALVSHSPQAIIRYASEEPFDPDEWWKNTRDALAVSREIFGLLNVWAGFPARPGRPEKVPAD